ncbi:unnamed protein product [Mycena citricolor]|uniref:Nucleoporin nup45 n=1 Tax=Mycena citricolor TaxID=2018698 RepID=A0AAD2H6I7_9AGAR|nr:unnamed protein product [Mycena citricolor]
MAFATSSSAFGMKPSGSSIFGQSTPAPAAGGGAFGQQPTGAFGQPTTGAFGQPQNATGSAFGQSGASGGLFGNQQQQQQQPAPAANIFGQNQQKPGGLFGQAQNPSIFTQQQPQAGGLFGNTQPQQQQPTTGGGLFGAQPQQPTAGGAGGLFGNQQQQPAAGGGLFGSQQPQQPATGGGLFGAQQQQQQPASGGLFGQSTTGGLFNQTNAQPATGSNIFGQSTQPATGLFGQSTQPATGIFGSQPNQQQANSGGIFGNSMFGKPTTNGAAGQGMFGSTTNPLLGNNNAGSMFGSVQPVQQQPPAFTKSTKFNDLPDAIKKTFEDIESHIQNRIQISKDLHQRKLGEEALKGQDLIRAVHKDLVDTTTALRHDSHVTRDLKAKTDQAVQDTIVATRLVDGFRNPHANAVYLKDHAGFPLEFFTRVATQMRERLAWYKSTIEQIERKLSSSAGQLQVSPQAIQATLQAQNETFLALAAKTAALDAQLQRIKQVYSQLYRMRTGSHRDPFEGGERGDLGIGSLGL